MNLVAQLFTSVPEYVALPIPSPLDVEVERVMRIALRGGASDLRALVADAIESGTRPAFPVASGRIQRLAMDSQDLDLLRLALETYVAFVNLSREDPRDLILVLDHFADDLVRLGSDPARELRRLVALSIDPERHETLEGYLDRERFHP